MSKKRFIEKLNLTEDIISGIPVVTITGNSEVYVENYRGIIEYGDKCIRIETKNGRIKFAGNNLKIEYYTNTDMKINGQLENVYYC